jgi:hypothetical protein
VRSHPLQPSRDAIYRDPCTEEAELSYVKFLGQCDREALDPSEGVRNRLSRIH